MFGKSISSDWKGILQNIIFSFPLFISKSEKLFSVPGTLVSPSHSSWHALCTGGVLWSSWFMTVQLFFSSVVTASSLAGSVGAWCVSSPPAQPLHIKRFLKSWKWLEIIHQIYFPLSQEDLTQHVFLFTWILLPELAAKESFKCRSKYV